ncbi:putative pentatricopeptide repeat-containing protein At3g08820 [Malania oleifera]|uniref:putative pentatricopeptide repeat-containing protein At3g08820 n=1 Tax=Malania oleifera TaxID=397392 RepID=UPI0025ADD653|nr:putative pentatricopeptide repeat-containing protein At3g08820 [Malania oleifera]
MTILANPTSVLFPKALEIKKRLLQGFSSFKQLKHVHARLLRLGLDQDNYLLNMILRSSFDSGNASYPRILFNQTLQPNIFLWNTLIRGLVTNDCFDEAVGFYSLMRTGGFLPNNFTFPFVLKACARLSDLQLGVKIHAIVVKAGFDFDVFVKTSLVCLYAKCGILEYAHKVFDDIPEKNVVSWTAIITGYIDFGRFREAIDLFQRFLELDLRPDSFALVRVLSACTQVGDLRSGEWIHGYIAEIGMGRNVFVATALLDMYAKCGKMEQARSVFDGMPEKDIVSWGTVIQGYALNGFPKEALDLFFQMQRENVKPDHYSMVGILSACARLGALQLGDWASGLIDRNEILSNPILGTALIDMYAKCGNMASAWRVFKGMRERDVVVWNAAISGLSMNGHVKTAFALFGQVEKLGFQPDGSTFIGLLCGCSHAGLVDEGRRYFYSMNRIFCLTPTIEHYGCMVDLLSRAGLLEEAHQMIKSMPMEANAVIWGALLAGCRVHRNVQLAECALKRMIELEPWNSGNYVLLSNIYSASHRWENAEKLRSRMNEKGILKAPGCSWIEVDGVVQEFLVGDKSHPLSEKIYAKLNELNRKLKSVGYIPKTDFVLFDIEEEEKEHFLGYHSEKLALAFGLISTKPEDVIRIVKNLRVCGDCHMAMKLISRITGREIIVRDNNRFHCFIEGSCSCKDYW